MRRQLEDAIARLYGVFERYPKPAELFGTECQTPGNVQINDSLPPDFQPQYPDFSLFGFGGHGHR